MREDSGNELLALHAERTAALAALGYRAGAAPPPLAVLYTALQVAPLRRVYAWGVPSEAALACLAKAAGSAGLVEVGAGTGFWSALLARRGVCVRAYDAAPVDCAGTHNGHHAVPGSAVPPPPFAAVARRDAAAAAAAHPRRALLLCWPPPEDVEELSPEARSLAADALNAYRGTTVCYVGEGAPGVADAATPEAHQPATAGPAFFGALSRDWALQSHVPLPRWPQAYDSLTVWRRKEACSPSSAADVLDDDDVNPAPWTPPPGAEAVRASMLAAQDAAWANAAAAHIMARAAAGGPRASPGPESAAVEAAKRGAPLLRRMMLRLMC
jgi:hypothetical protein